MKKITLTFIFFLFAIAMMAQVPAGFSYQAVVRNNSGEIVASQTVKFRFSILQNSSTGTSVYVETQSAPTNNFGLANLVVGAGNQVSGNFDPAGWETHSHFLKVELDPNNGTSFSHLGTMQLMAVPYAFHAQTVGEIPDNSVTSAKIADGTIIAADLASNAVTTEKINSEAVTAPKLASMGASSGQVLKWSGTNWAPATDETGDLILPYNGTTSEGLTGFQIHHTGSSGNIKAGYFSTQSPDGIGLYGDATSTTGYSAAGYFVNLSNNGKGVVGIVNAPTGVNYGGAFSSSSPDGSGVFGISLATSGHAIGGQFLSPSTSGRGVYGSVTSSSGETYGGFFISSSASGYGAYGESPRFGIYGKSTGFQSRGVAGEATGTNSIGVFGFASNENSTGVYGRSPKNGIYGESTGYKGRGVAGEATGTNSIGVRGIALNDNSTGVWGEGENYDFYANGPGVDYGTGSSIRWKRNIMEIPDPLAKIAALRGVYFDWDEEHGGKHDVGMIAEEVGAVLPEIVIYEENGIDAMGMDYSKIGPLLVEAVKALKAENDRLKVENSEQNSRLEKLERFFSASVQNE